MSPAARQSASWINFAVWVVPIADLGCQRGTRQTAGHRPRDRQSEPLLITSGAILGTPRRKPLQIIVRDNNIDQALKALKKKMQREGIFREMKLRGHYEKPSEKRARERAEAVRRYRKLQRKRLQREGVLPR
jgi:small subunit ribosomal protein S21